MKEKGKRLSKKIIFAIVAAAIIGSILIAYIGLEIAFAVSHRLKCWAPDYEKRNILPILEKRELTDEDYKILYEQTGLTRVGIERMRSINTGVDRILKIQTDYFTPHTLKKEHYAPLICTDYIEQHVNYSFLQNGDIIVTSSTHLSGWRMGHAGLVTNASAGYVLQATAVGEASKIGRMTDFNNRLNFMILSPKVDAETKAKVCAYAENNLIGKVYDPTAGVFTSKNSVERTQCSHIIWYAYNLFGTDLDCGGGLVVTPKDIANSPNVEIVQVFGFDPAELWKY